MATQPIDNTGADDGEQQSGNAAEAEALLLGWKPQDQFKGPADKWTDAETFVAKRNDHVGMLRNDYEKLQRQFRDLEKKSARAEREGFNRAMETVAAKQRAAVETGDTEAFDAAEKERKKLEEDAKVEPVDVEQRQEEFIEWRADNLWYGDNKLLTDYADTAAEKMMKEKGGFLGQDDLAALARKVKDRFGDKFPDAFGIKPAKGADDDAGEDDKPRRRSPVEGVSQARGKGGPKSAADLDSRAKEVGNSLVKMGLYKDLNEYAKDLYK